MKRLPILGSMLALSIAVTAPAVLAHAGHGDEFQAEGGVNRVEVKARTDALLGIQTNPIETAADGSGAVMIPVSALVEDNGRQLVFVEYENFYEPVDVTTGETAGELIEITEGLSVGEQLVTQGSLSLYAESRKSQTAEAAPETEETAANETSVQETTTQETTTQETTVESSPSTQETADASGGFPVGLVAAVGVGAVAIAGAFAFLNGSKRKGGA